MRRRRGAVGEDSDLSEALLSDSEPSSSAPYQQEQQPLLIPHQHTQLIRYQPFTVDAFVQWIVQSWLSFLSTLSSCLQALLRGGGSTSLSLIQAERLGELQERLAVPYDSQDPQHRQQLRELWALAFPGTPCSSSLKAEQWKDMGWQSDDPTRDFRGAGLFGLDNLLYLGTHHLALFKQLMNKTQGTRSSFEYPFAVAGLNLTFHIAEVLGIHNSPGELPKTAAGRAFCELLRDSDVAFEEVYVAAFGLLDEVWLRQGASYMEFGGVLKEVKQRLDAALRRRPRGVAELQQALRGRA